MLAGLGGLAAGAFLASTANAGPLTPPPGPISSTPGPEPRIPLDQSTAPGTASGLYRITEPGSYYLTGNIKGEVGKNGIEIASSDVTLDLMGFALLGIPGSLSGIRVLASPYRNIAVRNGSAHNWGEVGVTAGTGPSTNGLLEAIHCADNGSHGIQIHAGFTVFNCTSRNNSGNGIHAFSGNTISGCTTISNTGNGINTSSGCTVSNCTSSGNGNHGLSVSSYSTITGCTSHNNGGIGIATSTSSTISNCNSSINASEGISVNTGCAILNCMLGNNGANGISAASDCMIIGNSCRSHATAAGIRFFGQDNRVEDNNCTRNATGILATTGGNFIARNICSGNTTQNWNIAANNACLVVNATLGAAITGNSGGTSPGSTNPNANYTY
jgi:hypothetical protein